METQTKITLIFPKIIPKIPLNSPIGPPKTPIGPPKTPIPKTRNLKKTPIRHPNPLTLTTMPKIKIITNLHIKIITPKTTIIKSLFKY